jgi:hypothetical protein
LIVEKRRHHYVPVGIIKRFSLEGKNPVLYDVKTNLFSSVSPKNCMLVNDYHSVVLEDGRVDHNLIEDQFMVTETLGLKALRNFIDTKHLNSENKMYIADLWASQYIRTPVQRQFTEGNLKELIKASTKILSNSGELPPITIFCNRN